MTTTFPSEDMARNAARVWHLAKSLKVAMVSLREALMADPGTMMPDLATGQMPDRRAGSMAGRMPDTLITRPLRARFQDDSNIIWFILPRRSAMAGLSRPDEPQSMLVTFSDGGEGDHIVFEGMAMLSDDRDRMAQLWDGHADIHFPQGPKDPNACLIRFEPRTAQFWTGGQDLVSFAVHYITAKLTGEPQKVGSRGVVAPM